MGKDDYKRTGYSATTQSRKVCVYLKKIETKRQLKELAEEKCLGSVSTLVRMIIEKYIANVGEMENKGDLKMKIGELEEQVQKSDTAVRHKNILIESLETKNKEYLRKIEFLEKKKERKTLDKRLVWLLLNSDRPIKEDDLYHRLAIDRKKDEEAVISLHKDLELLLDSGLVTVTKNGWMWVNP